MGLTSFTLSIPDVSSAPRNLLLYLIIYPEVTFANLASPLLLVYRRAGGFGILPRQRAMFNEQRIIFIAKEKPPEKTGRQER